jgi:hypothetical protein
MERDMDVIQLDIEALQYNVDRNREDYRNNVLSEATARINEKQQGVDARRIELAEKQKALDEVYNRLLEKCSFTADEDQWLMWGKIIRLATNASNSLEIRKSEKEQLELNRQEAIRNNVDPATLSTSVHLTSIDEMFQEVYSRLDLYVKYNQEVDVNANFYASAAKQYYKMMRKGKAKELGVLLFGTKDNVPHPVLKPGDIIVEYKGKPIKFVDDFFALKDDPAERKIKFMRLSPEEELNEITKVLPESDVLIGLIDLWEDLD